MPYSTKNDDFGEHAEFLFRLRYARLEDVAGIQKLLEPYANQGILLYKDQEKIIKDLPHTLVSSSDGRLIGVANLYPYDSDLYEIRGLAVDPAYQNQGIGKTIIEKLLQDLKKNNPKKQITIFALTIVPGFFMKLGWRIVTKEKFPRKIFDDCSYCVKQNNCFEEAVEFII